MDYNEQTIIGTVGATPIERGSGEKKAVVFSVATNSKYKGEKKVIWNNIVAFGKLSEICLNYVDKGTRIFIQGTVSEYKFRKEEEDTDRIKHEIIANKILVLEKYKDTKSQNGTTDLPF